MALFFNKKMTVVTQFITDDGTDTGELVEMRRIYVQDGKVFENSVTNQPGNSLFPLVQRS